MEILAAGIAMSKCAFRMIMFHSKWSEQMSNKVRVEHKPCNQLYSNTDMRYILFPCLAKHPFETGSFLVPGWNFVGDLEDPLMLLWCEDISRIRRS